MRVLAAAVACALGAAALLLAGSPAARADSPDGGAPSAASAGAGPAVPAQPGTEAEARDYGLREAASPEAGEFTGGAVAIFISVSFFAGVLIIGLALVFSSGGSPDG